MEKHNFTVTGMTHYLDNLLSLTEEDSDYLLKGKEFIEEYEGRGVVDRNWFNPKLNSQVELIPEPSNPHDPNAVRVEVAGKHIGYIKSGSCSQVKNLLTRGAKVTLSEIHYGPAKWTYEDEDGQVRIAKRNRPPFAQVTLIIGEEETAHTQQAPEKKKKSPALIFCTVMSVILFLIGLLLIIASPIAGIITALAAVGLFFYAKAHYRRRP